MTPPLDRAQQERLREELYVCGKCGYNPRNRADWCDSGCGSDYNRIFRVPIPEPYLAAEQRADRLETALRDGLHFIAALPPPSAQEKSARVAILAQVREALR